MKNRKLKSLTALLLVCALFISYWSGIAVYAIDDLDAPELSATEAKAPQVESSSAVEDSASERSRADEASEETAETEAPADEETASEVEQTGAEDSAEAATVSAEPIEAETSAEAKKLAHFADSPALEQCVTVDGVEIRLTAEAGVFPAGAMLFAERAELAAARVAEDAVESEREAGRNVVASYTFDIKVLSEDGAELQPADEKLVQISFALAEVDNRNLDTQVYHIVEDAQGALEAQSLQVQTQGKTATVETEGFSYYTVEFSYGEKQFVMEGDTELPLSEILEYLGLTGTVTQVEVSNPELFYAVQDDSGVWYVIAEQPFETEEWMRVTIDGIVFEIVVTDDINYGNGGHNGGSGVGPVTANDEDFPGIHQGTSDDLAATAPLMEITILDSRVQGDTNANNAIATINPLAEADGFFLSTHDGRQNSLFFKSNTQGIGRPGVFDEGKNEFRYSNGPIVTYKFENAALLQDGTYGDVIVDYESVSFVLPMIANSGQFGNISIGNGNGFHTTAETAYAVSGTVRVGIVVQCRIQIVDEDGANIPGDFLFPMRGITVSRSQTPSWVNDFRGYEEYHTFDEGASLLDGYVIDNSGYYLYIPGNEEDTYRYLSGITQQDNPYVETGNYLFYGAGTKNAPAGMNADDILYAGFVAIGDNTNGGIRFVYQAGLGNSRNTSYGVNNYLLNGVPAHVIISSTGTGGMIQTTTGNGLLWANENGDLNDGTDLLGSGTRSVPDGKSVTYTMTPREGYWLESVVVDGLTVTLPTAEGGTTSVSLADGRTGILTKKADGVYTFTFPDNNADHEIHVHWEADHWFEKIWGCEEEELDALTFTAYGYLFDGTKFVENRQIGPFTVSKPADETDTNKTRRIVNADGTVSWKIKRTDLPIERDCSDHSKDHHAPLYWFITEKKPDGYKAPQYDNASASAPKYYDNGELILNDPTVVYDGTQLGQLNALIRAENAAAYAAIEQGNHGLIKNCKPVSLTIGKLVNGNQASRDKFFKISVKIENARSGESYNVNLTSASPSCGSNLATKADYIGKLNPNQLTAGDDGSITVDFYLQHGQSVVLEELPRGASYTVTEQPEDYHPSLTITGDDHTGDSQNVVGTKIVIGEYNSQPGAYDSSLRDDTTVIFTNIRDGVVPTGLADDTVPALILIALSLALSVLLLFGRRYRICE